MSSLKRVLITGGTGSFGNAFVSTVLHRFPDIERLVIFSRDELKQYEMAQRFDSKIYPQIRFFLGDIRDQERLRRALDGIDTVIHAAALKHVPIAEYNPFEFVKTNIVGAQNLIEACLDTEVRRVIALSTDKAAAPINIYGATKLCSDKLFIAGNNVRGTRDLRLAVVRYGNVMGSRGSVIPLFLQRRASGVLPITDPAMTRFNISLQEGVDMVLWALENTQGGEIFVPKLPSYRILDLARAVGPDCDHPMVGIRPGEKIHEEMITASDSFNTVDFGRYFAILPQSAKHSLQRYCSLNHCEPVPEGYAYNSGTNPDFLSVQQLRDLIRKHLDPSFSV
jgi:UDP-N-acetylglucosamine 4,6-dehydratase (inverting)